MQRLSPRLRSQKIFCKIWGKFFTQIYRDLYGDANDVGAHRYGHQHGGRKLTETSVTEFCYKSVNLSLEEL